MDNKNSKNDDYLKLSAYKGHPKAPDNPDFTIFELDGQQFFCMLDKKGNPLMRSQGYSSDKGRDNGIASVKKNRTIKDHWSIVEKNNKHFLSLRAGNHQEIALSHSYASKAEAEAALAMLFGGSATKSSSKNEGNSKDKSKSTDKSKSSIKSESSTTDYKGISRVVTGAAAASALRDGKIISESRKEIGEKRNVVGEKRNVLSEKKGKSKEDNYLKCEAYKGHAVTDKKNNVALFTGEDKQFYFAVYNKDGSVRLRSEGFESDAARSNELKICIENKENADRYTTIKKDKYFINILKDKKGREVARSCMSTELVDAVAYKYVAPAIATSSAAAAAAMTTKAASKPEPLKVVRKEKVVAATPVKKKVVATTAAKAAPVAEAATSGSGCMKWWWLPLLLLIPLLLWWFGCNKEEPVKEVKKEVVEKIIEKKPEPPVKKKVVPPPPPPPKTCNCSELTHRIFKIPAGPAPKTTTALGRAPEYGNSHALDPQGFYNKLNAKYKESNSERRFLDGIFKQLGFKNGWKDAKASDFSAVTVPRGVSGNLGTKTTHQTVYRKLDPTNPKDLKAFKITGKNACDLHFMKTCGNHFFFQKCK